MEIERQREKRRFSWEPRARLSQESTRFDCNKYVFIRRRRRQFTYIIFTYRYIIVLLYFTLYFILFYLYVYFILSIYLYFISHRIIMEYRMTSCRGTVFIFSNTFQRRFFDFGCRSGARNIILTYCAQFEILFLHRCGITTPSYVRHRPARR